MNALIGGLLVDLLVNSRVDVQVFKALGQHVPITFVPVLFSLGSAEVKDINLGVGFQSEPAELFADIQERGCHGSEFLGWEDTVGLPIEEHHAFVLFLHQSLLDDHVPQLSGQIEEQREPIKLHDRGVVVGLCLAGDEAHWHSEDQDGGE